MNKYFFVGFLSGILTYYGYMKYRMIYISSTIKQRLKERLNKV